MRLQGYPQYRQHVYTGRHRGIGRSVLQVNERHDCTLVKYFISWHDIKLCGDKPSSPPRIAATSVFRRSSDVSDGILPYITGAWSSNAINGKEPCNPEASQMPLSSDICVHLMVL